MNIEKFNCSTCEFWRRLGENPLGECRRAPPRLTGLFWMRSEFPNTFARDFCGEHSDYRAYESKGIAHYAVKTWKEWLDYKPGVYPDENAAGFSRQPSLVEALPFAVKPDSKEKPQ